MVYLNLRIWVSPIMKKRFRETKKRWVGTIILNKHFLFIQIPKTGTKSLVKACAEKNLVTKDKATDVVIFGIFKRLFALSFGTNFVLEFPKKNKFTSRSRSSNYSNYYNI